MSRVVTRLRDNWKFTRTPIPEALKTSCDDSAWETVEVPHDWAIAGPFDKENDIERDVNNAQADIEADVHAITGRTGGLPHVGEGWYRKWIEIPERGQKKCYRLECDGIMSHSTVYCNGEIAGSWPYGYSSFAFDITGLIKPGEGNLIAVYVNNPEKSSRWYPGAGIYRNIRLVELNPIHVDHWGVSITTPEISESSGSINLKTTLINCGNEQTLTLRTTILDAAGKKVAQNCPLGSNTGRKGGR